MRKVRPAPPTEIRICVICEKPFTCRPKEWDYSFRQRPTCGRTCGSVLRGRNRTYLSPRFCEFCGNEFKPRNSDDKYCKRACYWASKKGKPPDHETPEVQRMLVICPWCLIMHPQRPKNVQRGRIFCSKKCYRAFQAQFTLGKHIAYTDTNGFYLSKDWAKRARAAKRRDHWTCQGCGRGFRHNSPGMNVHHIRPRTLFPGVGDKIHPTADALSNLVTLCKSCHQRTHLGQLPQFLKTA